MDQDPSCLDGEETPYTAYFVKLIRGRFTDIGDMGGKVKSVIKMMPRFIAQAQGCMSSSPMCREGGVMSGVFLDCRQRNSVFGSLSSRLV